MTPIHRPRLTQPTPTNNKTMLAALLITAVAALLTIVMIPGNASAQTDNAEREPRQQDAPDASADSEIVVGRLVYDNGKTAVCFADQFLSTYARETGQNIRRNYDQVGLDSEELFDHPFVVFSGQEGFTLSQLEKDNLRRYLDRGGFILASAGCSNSAWAHSFESVITELYGPDAFTALGTDHPLFHTVYDIDHIDVRRPGGRDPIQALVIDARVRVIYSPLGLNDTGNAGGSCCCCGGSEIRNARFINVNALGYALTH